MMFILMLVALTRADYFIEKGSNGRAGIYTLEVCIGDEVNGIEYGYQLVENGNQVQQCSYLSENCEGQTIVCNEIGELDGEKSYVSSDLPESVAYSQEGFENDCSDHSDMPYAYVYLKGCNKYYDGDSYVKFEIKDNKLMELFYENEKCEGDSISEEIDECDKCVKGEKLHCKEYNAGSLTSILFFVFFLFFLF